MGKARVAREWTLGLIEMENHLVCQSTSSQLARLSFKTLQIVYIQPVGVTESSHYML